MSFYFDDDVLYATSKNAAGINSSQQDDDIFICENCGGNESYVDSSTGARCCGSCFTQSQSMVAASQDCGVGESALEFEDIMGLAARNRGGRLIQQRKPAVRKSGGGRKRLRQPLEELDRSVPLPDLITCLWAIQQVIQRAAVRTADLVISLECDSNPRETSILPSSFKQEVVETVRTIWMRYLTMWYEGAEYYAQRYPETRFSFRDCFLRFNMRAKNSTMRHLSYQASMRAKEELKIEDTDDMSTTSSTSSPNDDENDGEVSVHAHATQINSSIKSTKIGVIRRILLLFHQNARGRKEAALFLQPSMSLCAAIVWLAVRHTGVTASHISHWIANGSLPMINAFDSLLYPTKKYRDSPTYNDQNGNLDQGDTSDRRQKSLRLIAPFFRMHSPPRPSFLEYLAKLVAFCSGIVPSKDYVVSSMKTKKLLSPPKPNCWEFPILSSRNLPLVTARMVMDLGLSQQVLDLSLALMGLYPEHHTRTDSSLSTDAYEIQRKSLVPAPAHPLDRAQGITMMPQLAGVIVVACKLCPGWETWVYHLEPLRMSRGQHVKSKDYRFVPWSDQELRLITNNTRLESYIDFLEEILEENDCESVLPNFFDSTPAAAIAAINPDFVADHQPCSYEPHSNSPKDEGSAIASSFNPNKPNLWKRHKHHEWHLTLRKENAVWAEVNGVGDYVVYRDVAKEKYRWRKNSQPSYFPLKSLHPHYVLLLEYVAYVTWLPIDQIHSFVTELDYEINRKSCSRKRKR